MRNRTEVVPEKQIHGKRNVIIFKLVAISLPFVFILILEFSLRLFNYGFDSSLFVKDKLLPGYYSMNQDVARLFFNEKVKLTIFEETFKKEKPAGTYRIFVLGESTGLGFPYLLNGSFHRMLLYRLNRTFPDKKIEILNLSLTGVNSYTINSFANEVIEMNPDAIMIYVGHNEYYGALGVASTQRFGSNRNFIKATIFLKKFKVVQLAFNFSGKVKSIFLPKTEKKNMAMMQQMAGKQEVAYGSRMYQSGLVQFEENMDEVVRKFSHHQIPVYISNVVSNQKDQKPFISKLGEATDTTKYLAGYQLGIEDFNRKDFKKAKDRLLAVNKIDSTYAMTNFLLGEICYSEGDYDNALRYYLNSKEYDALRFRAPEAINGIIKKLCKKYKFVYLADSYQKFLQKSEQGILGENLFTEHVHPTLPGYFLISDAFYDALHATKAIGNWDKYIPADSIYKEMPVTVLDSLTGKKNVIALRREWPFYEKTGASYLTPFTYARQLSDSMLDFNVKMSHLRDYYLKDGNPYEALRVQKGICLQFPFAWAELLKAGQLCMQLNYNEDALFYLKNAFENQKDEGIAKNISFVLIKLDKLPETKPYLNYISQSDPNDKLCLGLLKSVDEIMKLKSDLDKAPTNTETLNALARYYLKLGNKSIAKAYLEKSLTINPYDANIKRIALKLNVINQFN
jgi:tetratricopeptide (TPR) repeat protein